MSEEFSLDELRDLLINKEQPVGFDEFILLIAEYIGDEDIDTLAKELVDDLYDMFKICKKYYSIKEILESEEK